MSKKPNDKPPIVRLKERLQFTGWLQYLPIAALTGLFAAISGLLRLILAGFPAGYFTFLSFAAILAGRFLWEILHFKLGMRLRERIPITEEFEDEIQLMRSRVSCRSFQSRNLNESDRTAVLESARVHASSGRLPGSQGIRYEYVDGPVTVWPVVGARESLVAIAPAAYSRINVIEVGRSLQHVVLEATAKGIATCWIGPGADNNSVIRYLGDRFDPVRDHIICLVAIGYRSRYWPWFARFQSALMHRRKSLEELFFADPEMTRPQDLKVPSLAELERIFEVLRWAPSSFDSQTTRCVIRTATCDGAIMQTGLCLDFYAATESHFYAPVALGIWCAIAERGWAELGIRGVFAALDTDRRLGDGTTEAGVYGVSWIVEPA